MDLKAAGSRLYLVGATRPELGGSHYLAAAGREGGTVPRPDLEVAPRILRAAHAAIRAGSVLACHDLSEGGLAVAAAEMAFAGEIGLEIDLAEVGLPALEKSFDPDSTRLYSQSCSRLLVEVAEGVRGRVRARVHRSPLRRDRQDDVGREAPDPRERRRDPRRRRDRGAAPRPPRELPGLTASKPP
jgi:phosphoribosylformylglycinamidine synthase